VGLVNRQATDAPEQALRRRLSRLNLVSAVAFILGGSLFALGAAFAQLAVGTLATVNITYLVGGFFFSLGGYASILLVVNAARDERHRRGTKERMRWWSFEPQRRDWVSAVVLFGGTLLFAVSLVAAFAEGLTPRQSNGWIWLPDILGCVCFLVSGRLAMLEVGAGHVVVRVHEVGWWVVAVNQLGSILFFLAGIAAFTRPATSSALDAGIVNWGTFSGAVCFAVGGVIQVFDKPTSTRTVVQHTS
jgi:MFS family permease